MDAQTRHAVVRVNFATISLESWPTGAPVGIYLVYTCSPVHTIVILTFVQLYVAVRSRISRSTRARVTVHQVFACAMRTTRRGLTRVIVQVTVDSLPSCYAGANVRIQYILARAMHTRIASTCAHTFLASITLPARSAAARIRINTVHTTSSVQALMINARINGVFALGTLKARGTRARK